jgi:hypothetical protein
VTSFAASVADPRYANQLLISAVHSLRDRSRPVADLGRTRSIAAQLSDAPEPAIAAWRRLFEYRVAIRELLDHHFNVRLSDYLSRDKREFVRIMLETCATPAKLRTLLKEQVVPFCECHSIRFADFLIAALAERDWPLDAKFDLIQDFLTVIGDRQAAVNHLQFADEAEFGAVSAFARDSGLQSPAKRPFVRRKVASGPVGHAPRSTSMLQIRATTLGGRNENRCVASPSVDLSSLVRRRGSAAVADGVAENAIAYAEKLRPFREDSEIRPLYGLALNFAVCVSADGFRAPGAKRELFGRLLRQCGPSRFDEICDTLEIAPAEVVAAAAAAGPEILPRLGRFVKFTNVKAYTGFVEKCAEEMRRAGEPAKRVARLYWDSMAQAVKFVAAEDMGAIAARMRSVRADLLEGEKGV